MSPAPEIDVLDVVEIHGPKPRPNDTSLLLGLRLKDGRIFQLSFPSNIAGTLLNELIEAKGKEWF